MTYKAISITPTIIIDINIASTTYMMMKPLNNKSIKIPQDYRYVVLYKVIMPLFLLMVKQEQEKHLQWKDLSIICMMMKEESFQEQFKIFLDTFKAVRIRM